MEQLTNKLKNTKIQFILISFFAVFVYLNSLPNQLVWDDRRFIKEWTNIQSFSNIPGYFKGDYAPRHDGKYRPIKGVILSIDYHLWGQNPIGYHLQAIIIHLLATLLIWAISISILKNKLGALFTALIFAVHPIHVEAITFITSSTDILGIVFLLFGFLLYIKKDEIDSKINKYYLLFSSLFLALLAYLTNEIALVILPLFILYDICFRKLSFKNISQYFRYYIPHIILVSGYLFLRFSILKIVKDADFVIDKVNVIYLIMFEAIGKYIKLLFFPYDLSVNHEIKPGIYSLKIDIDPSLSLANVLDLQLFFWIIIVFIVFGIALFFLRKAPIVSFSIFWFFISLVPVSNFSPIPALMTERYAYLASIGYCLLIGFILSKFFEQKKSFSIKLFTLIIFLILVTAYSARTIIRNSDWKNGMTLWTKTVKQIDKSMIAHANLASDLAENRDFKQAIQHYKIAESLNYYKMPQVYLEFGKTYFKNNQFDLAKKQLDKAISSNVNNFEAFYYKGVIFTKEGSKQDAIKQYKKAISINPQFYDAYINLGFIYYKSNNLEEAVNMFEKAKQVNPRNGKSYNNLAVIYAKLGKIDKAIEELRKSVELDPDDNLNKANLKKLEDYNLQLGN